MLFNYDAVWMNWGAWRMKLLCSLVVWQQLLLLCCSSVKAAKKLAWIKVQSPCLWAGEAIVHKDLKELSSRNVCPQKLDRKPGFSLGNCRPTRGPVAVTSSAASSSTQTLPPCFVAEPCSPLVWSFLRNEQWPSAHCRYHPDLIPLVRYRWQILTFPAASGSCGSLSLSFWLVLVIHPRPSPAGWERAVVVSCLLVGILCICGFWRLCVSLEVLWVWVVNGEFLSLWWFCLSLWSF